MSAAPSPVLSRRLFLEAALAGAVGLGCRSSRRGGGSAPAELSLTLAGYQYDRVRPLVDGRVRVAGCSSPSQ